MANSVEKRRSIIQAADRIFRNKRFDEVKLDEVARAAHVGKGTIYLYFKNKEDLFFQVATDGFEELCNRLYEVMGSNMSLRDKLCAIFEEMGSVFGHRKALFRTIHSPEFAKKQPGAHEIMAEHKKRLREVVKKVLKEGVDSGVLRKDLDLDVVECALVGAVHAREIRMSRDGVNISTADLVDILINGAVANRK